LPNQSAIFAQRRQQKRQDGAERNDKMAVAVLKPKKIPLRLGEQECPKIASACRSND